MPDALYVFGKRQPRFDSYLKIETMLPPLPPPLIGFWFRHRSAIAARIVAGVAVSLWTISAVPYFYYFGGEAVFRAQLRSRQETLRQATTIAGIQLPAGTLVTYASNARDLIESLELQQEASVHGVPLTGLVNFDAGRPDGYVTLARDAEIDEVPCSAQENVQLKRGTLNTCTLARPARIHGIPCRGEVSLSNDGVGCILASDNQRFGVTWRAGTGVTVAKNEGTFDVMSRAPNLYVLGAPLPGRAIVTFDEGRLSEVNFSINPWHFHGCSLMFIEVRYGAIREPRDSCGFPRDRFGNVVLPATAFTVH
jgi:hypothetical protein